MNIVRFISRILIGVVFIYSGFVKGIDPLGSTYKFTDYFFAFGMDSFEFLAFPLSVIMSTIEFVIGVSLLFGVRMVLASWAALIFMAFFTPLTLYLALANPVSDCGCFGDALILTNWQTFYKNLIILIPTLTTFYLRKQYPVRFKVFAEWAVVGVFVILIVGTSIYSYQHLPILDFRPYKTGTYIPDAMTVPDDAPRAEYKTITYYQKDGVEKSFVFPDGPDSTWTWVKTDNELIKKGYTPPIHDFVIETLDGEDITDEILYDEGYTFLLVSYDLRKSNIDAQQKINELAMYCESKGHNFICLTSTTSEIDQFVENTEAPYQFCSTDEITLKTMIRANPGLILLKNGVVMGKLNHNDIPEIGEFNDNFLAYTLTKSREKIEDLLTTSLILSLLLVLSLFVLITFLKRENGE
ncbi:MAG: DoxX family protein [Bacteroidales bacterium]|nr:DoxX family protein [Bacteroidales bacterium]